MSDKTTIQNQITDSGNALITAAGIIQTGGQLSATELRTLLQNQISAFSALLTLLNQNTYNMEDNPMSSENLFTRNLILTENRTHNLGGFEFSMMDNSNESFISSMNMAAPTMVFDVMESGTGTTDSNASLGLSIGELFLSAKRENYRNRVVHHTPEGGITLASTTWKNLFKTGFAPLETLVEIEYRLSGYLPDTKQFYFKKQTALLSWNANTHQHTIWPDLAANPIVEGSFSSLTSPDEFETVQTRMIIDSNGYFVIEAQTPGFPATTIWHYEINIRTL